MSCSERRHVCWPHIILFYCSSFLLSYMQDCRNHTWLRLYHHGIQAQAASTDYFDGQSCWWHNRPPSRSGIFLWNGAKNILVHEIWHLRPQQHHLVYRGCFDLGEGVRILSICLRGVIWYPFFFPWEPSTWLLWSLRLHQSVLLLKQQDGIDFARGS